MKNLKIKNLTVASAFVAANVISIGVSAQTLYSGPSTIFISNGTTYEVLTSTVNAGTPFTLTFNSSSAVSEILIAVDFQLNNSPAFYLYPGPSVSVGANSWTYTADESFNKFKFNPANDFTLTDLLLYVGSPSSFSSVNLIPNAYALRSVYNIQSAAINAGLSYDCNVFDKQGICLSTGGRYSTTNSPETTTTSGLLIGSYRYNKNIRLGAWVDQNLSTKNTNGVQLGNSKPLFGVFGAWAERPDGLGYEVKVSAGYGDKDLIVARTATNEGAANLNTTGIQTVSSYGVAIAKDWIASPYVGVKYLSIKRAAYVQGGQDGLVYDSLRQETTSALAGLSLKGRINPQTFTVLSAGVEHDLSHNVGEYSAMNSSFTLTTTVFNAKPQRTRPVVSAGVYYDIDKTQRVGLNAIHRQEAFQSTATTSALATYTVGF